jgi:hypothetical protein
MIAGAMPGISETATGGMMQPKYVYAFGVRRKVTATRRIFSEGREPVSRR